MSQGEGEMSPRQKSETQQQLEDAGNAVGMGGKDKSRTGSVKGSAAEAGREMQSRGKLRGKGEEKAHRNLEKNSNPSYNSLAFRKHL